MLLLSRPSEAVLAAKKQRLEGAVALEIGAVAPEHAVNYLLGAFPSPPPRGSNVLSQRLLDRPDSVSAKALENPLLIGLLREAYGANDPVDELTDEQRFPTVGSIRDHLLDHAVTAAYAPIPGHPRPRYTPEAAERALRYLAHRLAKEETKDLEW